MGRLADAVIDALLDAYFGDAALTVPATIDVGLSTTQPANDGTNVTEPPGAAAYARVSVTNDLTHWPAAAARQKSNGQAIAFPQPTGSWGTVGWFTLYNHGTGAFIGWGALATARTITATSSPPTFDVGTLVLNAPGT